MGLSPPYPPPSEQHWRKGKGGGVTERSGQQPHRLLQTILIISQRRRTAQHSIITRQGCIREENKITYRIRLSQITTRKKKKRRNHRVDRFEEVSNSMGKREETGTNERTHSTTNIPQSADKDRTTTRASRSSAGGNLPPYPPPYPPL